MPHFNNNAVFGGYGAELTNQAEVLQQFFKALLPEDGEKLSATRLRPCDFSFEKLYRSVYNMCIMARRAGVSTVAETELYDWVKKWLELDALTQLSWKEYKKKVDMVFDVFLFFRKNCVKKKLVCFKEISIDAWLRRHELEVNRIRMRAFFTKLYYRAARRAYAPGGNAHTRAVAEWKRVVVAHEARGSGGSDESRKRKRE